MKGEPLVELRHTRDRMVLTADIAGFLICVSLYLAVPTIVQFVQAPRSTGYGFGSSIIVGGCSLIPLSAGTLVASRYGARFERRFGQRPMIPVGSAIFTAAMLLFAFEHSYIWEAFVVTAMSGIGMGFTFAAMPSFIVRSVASHQTGSAMGFYQLVRSVGFAVGSAVAAVVLATFSSGSDPFPRVEGFQTCLFLGAGLCVVAGVVSYFLPGRMTGMPAVSDETIIETAELEGSGILLDAHPIESATR
jgi:MFS family permease